MCGDSIPDGATVSSIRNRATASSDPFASLVKFMTNEKWRATYNQVLYDHFDNGLGAVMSSEWSLALWFCAVNDFLTAELEKVAFTQLAVFAASVRLGPSLKSPDSTWQCRGGDCEVGRFQRLGPKDWSTTSPTSAWAKGSGCDGRRAELTA